MTTPGSERFDMNAVLRAATGRGQTTETEPDTTDESSSNAEPEPERSMNDLIRRAFGRSHEQPDEQPSETTKPKPNDVFNAMLRVRSGRQFSFGLPMSSSSNDETEDAS